MEPDGILNGSKKTDRKARTPKIIREIDLNSFLNFSFLLKVTGIPATEAQSLKSKGDLYREYQRTTSVFIPWFPKK